VGRKNITASESPVKAKPKLVGITFRVDVETNRLLSAILSLKGMTLSGFLHDSIRRFIRDNYQEAKQLFDISRIAGLSDNESGNEGQEQSSTEVKRR
jgi:hypothetical protein